MQIQKPNWITLKQKLTNECILRQKHTQSVYDYPTQKKFFVFPTQTTPHISYQNHYNTFQFNCFNLNTLKTQKKNPNKPEPFLGAFFHIQHQFDCFDIKVRVPNNQQSPPFSNILSFMRDQSSHRLQQIQHNGRQAIDDSIISEIVPQSNNLGVSHFTDYQGFLDSGSPSLRKVANWEDRQSQLNWSKVFEFDRLNNRQIVNVIEQHHQILLISRLRVSESQIILHIAQMLQGIQGNLFTLDYGSMKWSMFVDAITLEQSLKNSLEGNLRNIISMANCCSRIQIALEYIRKNEYRLLYTEVNKQIRNLLIIFSENMLESIESNPTLLQFVASVQQMNPQISLIYRILINETAFNSDNKSFFEFDYRFLNAEYIIFAKVNQLSKIQDSVNCSLQNIANRLLIAVFCPLLSALNRAVFSQYLQIPNRDSLYLQFYFDNVIDFPQKLGRKLNIIKNESAQLYQICKRKLSLKIIHNLQQLFEYQRQWNKIYSNKKKEIIKIKNRQKESRMEIIRKKEEERAKQIYELKKKVNQNLQNQKKIKSQKIIKTLEEADRIKKQIAQREEKRKLTQMIEKEKEKGNLLEYQIQQKRYLISQKQSLINKANKLQINLQLPSKNPTKQSLQTQLSKKIDIDKQKSAQSKKIVEREIVMEQRENKQIKIENKNKADQQKKDLKIEKGKRDSKIRKISKNQRITEQKAEDSDSVQLQKSQNLSLISDDKQLNIFEGQGEQRVNSGTVLQICIDNIIQQQIQITHMAMTCLIYDKYCLLDVMQFMRKIFMGGNGEKLQDFLDMSVNISSEMDLKYFKQSSLLDDTNQMIKQFKPEFYRMKGDLAANSKQSLNINGEIRFFHDKLELAIGFQFKKLPAPLEPYFSYIHLSKYMQIFSYILRLKHCENLVALSWKQLNIYKFQFMIHKNSNENIILMKLYATRHIIQSFLVTFQNYLFFRVIEKEQKSLKNKMMDLKQMDDLVGIHTKMLDNIMRNGFISNPHNDVSKKMKEIFSKIRDFKNIVDMFCVDDIPSYLKQEVQNKVNQTYRIFKKHQQWFQKMFLTL